MHLVTQSPVVWGASMSVELRFMWGFGFNVPNLWVLRELYLFLLETTFAQVREPKARE